MVLLNRPLTEAEVIMLRDSIARPAPPGLDWLALMFEPKHCFIHYSAVLGKSTWTPPDLFYWRHDPRPSDCTWMVPGTQS